MLGCNAQAPGGQRATMTRAEFMDRCRVDRQIEACIGAVGRPDRTQERSGGTAYWYFDALTVDPVTGKRDSKAQVSVEHGVVRGVSFY